MLVLALDPGPTTGYAVRTNTGAIATGVFKMDLELWNVIYAEDWDAVVFERFTTGNRISKYGLETVRLIGSIEALVWQRNINIYPRMPQQRIAFLEAAKGFIGNREHEVDALAHLLSWEYKYAK